MRRLITIFATVYVFIIGLLAISRLADVIGQDEFIETTWKAGVVFLIVAAVSAAGMMLNRPNIKK